MTVAALAACGLLFSLAGLAHAGNDPWKAVSDGPRSAHKIDPNFQSGCSCPNIIPHATPSCPCESRTTEASETTTPEEEETTTKTTTTKESEKPQTKEHEAKPTRERETETTTPEEVKGKEREQLASTGTSVTPLAVGGGLLVLSGAGLTLAATRSRRRSSTNR